MDLSAGRPPGEACRHTHIMKGESCSEPCEAPPADNTPLDSRLNDRHSSHHRRWQKLARTHRHKGPLPFSVTKPFPERRHPDTPATKWDRVRTRTSLFFRTEIGSYKKVCNLTQTPGGESVETTLETRSDYTERLKSKVIQASELLLQGEDNLCKKKKSGWMFLW